MTNPLPEPIKVNGRYEITERPLGEGGMGVVYKAYDTVTKRFVALKTLWADAGPELIQLFEREWTVLARISHPNIVDILDTGDWVFSGQRRPYFVMPLLPGTTLEQVIKTTPQRLTVERTIDMMSQACRGLQAAHDQGLIHRDIKPSNIFVMEDDTVKIIDFGVVHLSDGHSVAGMKGTPLYMAPEQLEMKPATALSDIFSLGVVCYETLTGRKPFARNTEVDMAEAIRSHIPPPASEINPSVNQLVSRTVHKAMAKQAWHRFATARELGDTLQKALRNEPIERFERSKIQPRIERIKKAYTEGDYQFALEILTELESEGHIDPDMSILRIQIEQATRQKNIRQLLENARVRMEEEEYPLALQKIADVLAIDPENMDAHTLKTQIEKARSENQVGNWFRLVREHMNNSLFGQARQGLQEILKVDSANTQARQMLAEIDATEQDIVKGRGEKQRLYEEAVESYRNGEISTALSRLERVLAISQRGVRSTSPDLDAQCQSLYNEVRTQRDNARNAYAEGRKYLLDRNVTKALEICADYLRKHPGDPMFQALQLEAEELRRQEQSAAIADVSRRADAEADLDKKHNILKEAVEKYPDEPHFHSALKLMRDRRDLVNAIVGRARQYEERGQYNDAAGQWDILRNIYPLFPGLDFEIERLERRKQEQLQTEAKARWMEHVDSHFNVGDYNKALSVISDALAEFPGDRELVHLQSLADQGLKRSADADVLLKEGQDLCAARNYTDGLAALRKAERLDPRNRTARAALLSALVTHGRELISNDWRAAEPLVKEALDLEPSDPVARSLLSILDDHRRQDAIANILVGARNYQADGHLSDALQLVERGLVQYPNDHRLTQLMNSLRSQAVALGGEVAAPVRPGDPPPANADSALVPSPAATESGQPKLFTPPSVTEGTVVPPAALEETVVSSRPPSPAPARRERPPASTLPAILPREPGVLEEYSFKGPVWLIAGVAAAALIIAALVYSLFHKTPPQVAQRRTATQSAEPAPESPKQSAPQTRVVLFEANVPGASFSEDGKTLNPASELAPGPHTVEATREGYLSDLKSFVIDPAVQTPLAVKFDLRAILPQIRLGSSIQTGRVVLDDQQSVDLQSGAVSKEDLPLGPHTVKVYDGRREVFNFGFEVKPNQMPVLVTPLGTQAVPGAVIASLAGAARVYTANGLRAGGALPLRPVPPTGLEVPGSPAYPAHVLIENGKTGKPREQLVDTSAFPILTVQLAGATELSYLAVSANAANCVMSIDGQTYQRPLTGNVRSLPLAPGSHAVHLSCPGYKDAEQIALVKPGQSEKLNFILTPVFIPPAPAPVKRTSLITIIGAPPETLVFQNQVRIGTVGSDGTFSKEIEPGTYTWEWRKPGFETRRESRAIKAGEALRLEGALTASAGSLQIKVLPESARIAVRRESDNAPIAAANNGSMQLPSGSYRVTADAPDHKERAETVLIAGGKTVNLNWELERNRVVPAPIRFFENGDTWKQLPDAGDWFVHSGSGYSSLRSSTGSFSIDFLRKKAGFHPRKINILADCDNHDNCIIYSLDQHNFTAKMVVGGQSILEEKKAHGMDNQSSFHLLFEMSPDAIVVKNREGVVLSSVERKNPKGKLSIQDDIPLTIN